MFNPTNYGILPYEVYAKRKPYKKDTSYLVKSKGRDFGSDVLRLWLRSADDVALVVDVLGERCDFGADEECIYLYPGKSHKLTRQGGAGHRQVSMTPLLEWFERRTGDLYSACPVCVTVFEDEAIKVELDLEGAM